MGSKDQKATDPSLAAAVHVERRDELGEGPRLDGVERAALRASERAAHSTLGPTLHRSGPLSTDEESDTGMRWVG